MKSLKCLVCKTIEPMSNFVYDFHGVLIVYSDKCSCNNAHWVRITKRKKK